MPVIPPTKEDQIKALMYSRIAKEKGFENIRAYTRECMISYDTERFNKFNSRLAKSKNLTEILIEIAEEARNSPVYEKSFKKPKKLRKKKTKNAYDNYDHKAFGMIISCCKGFRDAVFEYYRFYRDLKRKGNYFEVYIDSHEENIVFPESVPEPKSKQK